MAGGSGLAREAVSLTQKAIEALRAASAPYRVPDQRCVGLAVRVAPSGLKTWDLAYRIKGTGRTRRVSLGRISDVTLETARDRANELTRAARAGVDLISREREERAAAEARISVEALIERYAQRRVRGRLRTAKEIESRLRRALAPFLAKPAEDLRRRDIRELLDSVADKGFQREAEKRRQTVGAMFRWALSQDFVASDPTAGLRGYDPGTPRDRVLAANEITTLLCWLDEGNLPQEPSDVLRLQLLTGARCGEISGMNADELNLQEKTWTLPSSRSKNGKARVTPLCHRACSILTQRKNERSVGPLFRSETGRALTSAHIGKYLQARLMRLPIAKFTTHDLRRTVATGLAELGISLELVAAIIGHEAGNKETRTLIRHYVRSDLLERKRIALEAWEKHLQIRRNSNASGQIIRIADRESVEAA